MSKKIKLYSAMIISLIAITLSIYSLYLNYMGTSLLFKESTVLITDEKDFKVYMNTVKKMNDQTEKILLDINLQRRN